jgi:hypothetical protein
MIGRQLFRIEPIMPAAGYKTYAVTLPKTTHWRSASCAEVECINQTNGFQITADLSTELGRKQSNYLRLKSGRSFTTQQIGDLLTFTFQPGQQCFEPHRVSLEREPNFFVKGGDYRGNPLGLPTRKLSAQSWVDDFGEHQERIAGQRERG